MLVKSTRPGGALTEIQLFYTSELRKVIGDYSRQPNWSFCSIEPWLMNLRIIWHINSCTLFQFGCCTLFCFIRSWLIELRYNKCRFFVLSSDSLRWMKILCLSVAFSLREAP